MTEKRETSRRDVLAGIAGSAALLGSAAHWRAEAAEPGPRFAVTIDDFRFDDGPILNGAARHRAILDALGAGAFRRRV